MEKQLKSRDDILKGIESKFIVLDPGGGEYPISEDLLDTPLLAGNPDLRSLISVELLKNQPKDEPPSIKIMRDLELVDYEPASDKGHFRFYPKGALVFNLLHAWAEEIALGRLGAYAIETPIIYDFNEPDIRAQAESFHERHYKVRVPDDDEQQFILRFAGDFGLFRMMKDAQLTYRHLPVRMYEFAPSFRYEQSGELAGLRRLRGFWMPDVHSFCADLQQGLEEYKELYRRYTELANGTGVNYAVAFRIVESFYQEHKEDILELLRFDGKPAMIELLSSMKHYWVMKHEINTIDFFGGACQVSTVQLDVKDASLYGINYTDADGQEKGCIIVHSSIGSPERWIYSILEDAVKHDPPSLPLWLAPTQVRLLPVSDEKHLGFCLQIAEALKKEQIRVDVDERSHPINWRIRAAEREWVPYILVCGDKEKESGQFLVRKRGGNQVTINMDVLIKAIHYETHDMPFRSLPGFLVSKRPIFRGRD